MFLYRNKTKTIPFHFY